MLIYSYVITSLPEKVQVYNNPTTSSSIAIAYTIGWSGQAALAARRARHRARVLRTLALIELKKMAPPMLGWSRPQASPVGFENDGAPS